MTVSELYERIRNWLWLYEHIPFPPSTDPKVRRFNDALRRKWKCEILDEVTEFKLPMELHSSPVELDLLMAIYYALLRDCTKLKEISGLLSNVQKYIVENQLCAKNSNLN